MHAVNTKEDYWIFNDNNQTVMFSNEAINYMCEKCDMCIIFKIISINLDISWAAIQENDNIRCLFSRLIWWWIYL